MSGEPASGAVLVSSPSPRATGMLGYAASGPMADRQDRALNATRNFPLTASPPRVAAAPALTEAQRLPGAPPAR